MGQILHYLAENTKKNYRRFKQKVLTSRAALKLASFVLVVKTTCYFKQTSKRNTDGAHVFHLFVCLSPKVGTTPRLPIQLITLCTHPTTHLPFSFGSIAVEAI